MPAIQIHSQMSPHHGGICWTDVLLRRRAGLWDLGFTPWLAVEFGFGAEESGQCCAPRTFNLRPHVAQAPPLPCADALAIAAIDLNGHYSDTQHTPHQSAHVAGTQAFSSPSRLWSMRRARTCWRCKRFSFKALCSAQFFESKAEL